MVWAAALARSDRIVQDRAKKHQPCSKADQENHLVGFLRTAGQPGQGGIECRAARLAHDLAPLAESQMHLAMAGDACGARALRFCDRVDETHGQPGLVRLVRHEQLLGLRPRLAHAALLVLITVAIVGSFQTVGTLLVFGLLVGPPATAALVVRRVPAMMLLGSAIGVASVFVGLLLSYHLNTSASATMAPRVAPVSMVERGMGMAPDRRAPRNHATRASSSTMTRAS